MHTKVVPLPALTWDDDEQPDANLLIDIVPGVASLLVRGRNAWHSTWVRHYFRKSMLFASAVRAQTHAERLRGRGNVFYVTRAPALQLVGSRSSIVLCDVHGGSFKAFTGLDAQIVDSPFGAYGLGLYPGVPLRDAYQTFLPQSGFWKDRSRDEHSIRTGLAPLEGTLEPIDTSLRSWKSFAQGTDRLMGWERQANNYSVDAVAELSRGWRTWLDESGVAQVPESEISRALLEFRNEELRVASESETRSRRSCAMESADAASREHQEARRRSQQAQRTVYAAAADLERALEARRDMSGTSRDLKSRRLRVESARQALESATAELEQAQMEQSEAAAAEDQAWLPLLPDLSNLD